MIDIKELCSNPDRVKESKIARNEDPSLVDKVIEKNEEHKKVLNEYETLRAQQKESGKILASIKDKEEKQKAILATKEVSNKVSELKTKSAKLEEELNDLAYQISNVIEGAPVGGEDDYVVLEKLGPAVRDFKAEGFDPLDHLDIGKKIKAIDVERGVKVSGTRFYFLTGVGAKLELAILNHACKFACENGFTPLITPTLVRPEIMQGTGFLGAHADEIYRLREPDDLYLTGTSEVALAGYHSDEILDKFPERLMGWSTCYRREAGSHGKDVRGIIRVHQFQKIEMFSYVKPEDAAAEHKNLLNFEKQMLKDMEIPFRVIDVAAGDLGSSAARKFDCEAWLPSQNRYLEMTSTSNCTTFQARRLKIRTRGEDKKTYPVATLNGTLATTRWIVCLLENHQQKDGSVVVPKALQEYVGTDVIKPCE